MQREWLTEEQFERAIAATNLLPGPALRQLAPRRGIVVTLLDVGLAGAIAGLLDAPLPH